MAVAQARFGVLPLNNNLHRYSVSPIDRNYAFCVSKIEDEYHFLFECPIYADLRERKNMQDSSIMSVRSALEAENISLDLSRRLFCTLQREGRKILENE